MHLKKILQSQICEALSNAKPMGNQMHIYYLLLIIMIVLVKPGVPAQSLRGYRINQRDVEMIKKIGNFYTFLFLLSDFNGANSK